jgi:hypothetical protein
LFRCENFISNERIKKKTERGLEMLLKKIRNLEKEETEITCRMGLETGRGIPLRIEPKHLT